MPPILDANVPVPAPPLLTRHREHAIQRRYMSLETPAGAGDNSAVAMPAITA